MLLVVKGEKVAKEEKKGKIAIVPNPIGLLKPVPVILGTLTIVV